MKKKPATRQKWNPKVLVSVILLHAAGLVGFGFWVVARILLKPKETITFTVQPRKVRMVAQTPEHHMNLAAHEAAAPKPTYNSRISASTPAKFNLPELPKVDLQQMLPLDPSELVSDEVSSLVGSAGQGTGLGSGLKGAGGLGNGKGTGLSFFGLKDTGRSLVIMIDVSNSMFGRTGDYDYSTRKKLREGKDQSFQNIRDEAVKLIDALPLNTRFGIIRWSGSARAWKPQLVPATPEAKAAAREHIQNEIDVGTAPPMGGRPGGTRHDYALELLFSLQPEVAFMLTDGNATASQTGGGMKTIPTEELLEQINEAKKQNSALPRVHTIYYLTGADKPEEEALLRGIARRTKGEFKKVAAKGVDEKKKDK